MTLNGVMTLSLRYFAEHGSFRDSLRKSGCWRYTDTFCEWNVAQRI